MRNAIYLLTCLIVLMLPNNSDAQYLFRMYPLPDSSEGGEGATIDYYQQDDTYTLVGLTTKIRKSGFDPDNLYLLLYRLNSTGDTIFRKTRELYHTPGYYGGTAYASQIRHLSDGSYLLPVSTVDSPRLNVATHTLSFQNFNRDGDSIRSFQMPGPFSQNSLQAYDVTPDDGVVLALGRYYYYSLFGQVFSATFTRLNDTGSILWQKVYAGSYAKQTECTEASGILSHADGSVDMCMNTGHVFAYPPVGHSDDSDYYFAAHPRIVKVDNNGGVIRDVVLNSLPGKAYGIIKDRNGGYFLWGLYDTSNHLTYHQLDLTYLSHLDDSFAVDWIRKFSPGFWRSPLKQLSNGDIWAGSFGDATVRFDRHGSLRWATNFHNARLATDSVYVNNPPDVAEGPGGSLAMTGGAPNVRYNRRYPIGLPYLLRTDSNGCLQPGCAPTSVGGSASKLRGFSIYPNPSSGQLNVVCPLPGTITISSIEGAVVLNYRLKAGTNALNLPVSLANGIYSCRYLPESGEVSAILLSYHR